MDPEISVLRTKERMDKHTDEAEFIGPFWLKLWVQLEVNVTGMSLVKNLLNFS